MWPILIPSIYKIRGGFLNHHLNIIMEFTTTEEGQRKVIRNVATRCKKNWPRRTYWREFTEGNLTRGNLPGGFTWYPLYHVCFREPHCIKCSYWFVAIHLTFVIPNVFHSIIPPQKKLYCSDLLWPLRCSLIGSGEPYDKNRRIHSWRFVFLFTGEYYSVV